MRCVEIFERDDNDDSLYFDFEMSSICSSLVNASKSLALSKDLTIDVEIIEVDFITITTKIIEIFNTIYDERYNSRSNFDNEVILIWRFVEIVKIDNRNAKCWVVWHFDSCTWQIQNVENV